MNENYSAAGYQYNLIAQRISKFYILLVFAAACASCVGFPNKPIPEEYVGRWTGEGNNEIIINADGNGGAWGVRISVDEESKNLVVGFLGFGKTHHIDQTPTVSNHRYTMILDGVTYTSNQYVK